MEILNIKEMKTMCNEINWRNLNNYRKQIKS